MLVSAPSLHLFESSVWIDHHDRRVASAMLRNEPPFQALRLRRLYMQGGLDSTAEVVTFSLGLRCHSSLEGLVFLHVALDTADAMDAVVDACIALRVLKLKLEWCHVVSAALPQLTRLIAAGALRELWVDNHGSADMFGEAREEDTQLFVAAARASAMTRLEHDGSGNLPENVFKAALYISARPQ